MRCSATYIPKVLWALPSGKYVIPWVTLALLATGCGNQGGEGKTAYNPKRAPQSATAQNGVAGSTSTTAHKGESDHRSVIDTTFAFAKSDSPRELTPEMAWEDSLVDEGLQPDDQPSEMPYDENEGYMQAPGQVEVVRERLLGVKVLKVINPAARDTVDAVLKAIEQRLSLSPEANVRTVVVESWSSPVNFKGYKFNRKKLMVYGLDETKPVAIYHYLNEFYIRIGTRVYPLQETIAYTPFVALKDTSLSRYLLQL
jgi:hypothetical protein